MQLAAWWRPRLLLVCCLLAAVAPGRARGQFAPTTLPSVELVPAGTLNSLLSTLGSRPKTLSQRYASPEAARIAALRDGTAQMRGVGLGGCEIIQQRSKASEPGTACFRASGIRLPI